MSNQPKTTVDVDYTAERVPARARKGFWPMFFIMLGFTFFSASMWTGVDLANGLDLNGFVCAILLGGVILAAYTGALGYICLLYTSQPQPQGARRHHRGQAGQGPRPGGYRACAERHAACGRHDLSLIHI